MLTTADTRARAESD